MISRDWKDEHIRMWCNNGKTMSGTAEKLCPFDKKVCIGIKCAIWSPDEETCILTLISRIVRSRGGQVKQSEKSYPPSLSGMYRDPLFD
jgi:hypothetical protein